MEFESHSQDWAPSLKGTSLDCLQGSFFYVHSMLQKLLNCWNKYYLAFPVIKVIYLISGCAYKIRLAINSGLTKTRHSDPWIMSGNKSVQIPKIPKLIFDCFYISTRPIYIFPWDCPGVSCKSVSLKCGDTNHRLFLSQDKLKKTDKRMPNTFPHVKLDALPLDSNPFKA